MSALKQAITSEYLVGSILVGADDVIAEAMRERIPHLRESGLGPCTAFGIVRDGRIAGGIAFNNYRKFSVDMSAVLDCALTRAELRFLCDYAFGQLDCKRVTAITGKKNKKARKALDVIGFKLEGVHSHGLDGREDAMSFGLLKENCKWIKHHGLIVSPSRS
jgi:RimJ/RimL family protein N-acetyltransferase